MDSVWKVLVDSHFGILLAPSPPISDWKSYFIEKYTLKKPKSMEWSSQKWVSILFFFFRSSEPNILSLKIQKNLLSARHCHTSNTVGDEFIFIGGQNGSVRYRGNKKKKNIFWYFKILNIEIYSFDPKERRFQQIDFQGSWAQIGTTLFFSLSFDFSSFSKKKKNIARHTSVYDKQFNRIIIIGGKNSFNFLQPFS